MPTTYFDGGFRVYIGTSGTSMRSAIGQSSARAVAPLDLMVRMEHLGGDQYDITVRIGNEVAANSTPADPAVDAGPTFGQVGVEYFYESATTDPEEDELYYQWDWGDGKSISEWTGPYTSGETCTAGHIFADGYFDVKVRAKDGWGAETEWSAAYSVHMQCCVVRGNVDHDPSGEIDISDLVMLVDYMFTQGPLPPCPISANIDGSCCAIPPGETLSDIDISDLVMLVDYMFNSGPAPPSCVR